jgi:pilus assembly protein CpaF
VASAIGVIIQANRLSDGTRKLTSIQEGHGHGRRDRDAAGDLRLQADRGRTDRRRSRATSAQPACGPRCWDRLITRGIELPQTLFAPLRQTV